MLAVHRVIYDHQASDRPASDEGCLELRCHALGRAQPLIPERGHRSDDQPLRGLQHGRNFGLPVLNHLHLDDRELTLEKRLVPHAGAHFGSGTIEEDVVLSDLFRAEGVGVPVARLQARNPGCGKDWEVVYPGVRMDRHDTASRCQLGVLNTRSRDVVTQPETPRLLQPVGHIAPGVAAQVINDMEQTGIGWVFQEGNPLGFDDEVCRHTYRWTVQEALDGWAEGTQPALSVDTAYFSVTTPTSPGGD